MIILVALFAVLWFVMIRPAACQAAAAAASCSSSVEPGDEVLTVGGIYGIVQEIERGGRRDLIVEIAEGIHVRVARRAVATVVKPDDEDDEDDDEDADDEDDATATPTRAASPDAARRRLDEVERRRGTVPGAAERTNQRRAAV